MNTVDRIKFISEMQSIGLMGGRKLSYYEVLEREVAKGNPKAIELFNKWRDKLEPSSTNKG